MSSLLSSSIVSDYRVMSAYKVSLSTTDAILLRGEVGDRSTSSMCCVLHGSKIYANAFRTSADFPEEAYVLFS